MAASWWFKEDSTTYEWTWRTIAADGSTLNTAGPFENYGKTVVDALKHGFRPTTDHWGIESTYSVARFKRGHQSSYIPKEDAGPGPKARQNLFSDGGGARDERPRSAPKGE